MIHFCKFALIPLMFKALSFCDFLCYNIAFSQSYKNCKINHIRQFINRLFYNFCKKAAYLSSFSKSTESKWEICFFVLTSCVNESLKSPFFTATKESR